MLVMGRIFDSSASIPCLCTRKPKNFPDATPKRTLKGIHSHVELSASFEHPFDSRRCSVLYFDFATKSST